MLLLLLSSEQNWEPWRLGTMWLRVFIRTDLKVTKEDLNTTKCHSFYICLVVYNHSIFHHLNPILPSNCLAKIFAVGLGSNTIGLTAMSYWKLKYWFFAYFPLFHGYPVPPQTPRKCPKAEIILANICPIDKKNEKSDFFCWLTR